MGSVTRFASAVLATSALAGTASAAVLDLPVTIDNGYKLVDLSIGTPPRTHQFLFDTGSASTWIIDPECAETCQQAPGLNRTAYDITASSTGKLTGQDASIEYLGGRVAGPTVEDRLSFGNVSWDGLFIAANESNWFALPADGFLGLAFGSIADGGATPVFESLIQQRLVDRPRFGIYYAREEGKSTGGAPGKGLLTLGGSREEEYVDGELATIELTSGWEGYDVWRSVLHTTTGTKKACNGTEIKAQTDFYGSRVVFDTGASGVSLSPDKIEDVYKSIGMNWTAIIEGDHIPLCSEFTDAWSITLEVGFYGATQNLTLTGDQLALPGFADRDDACWPPFDDSGSDGFTLIGTRLLRNFYTIWDYGSFDLGPSSYSARLSFGKLKPGL